MLRLYAGVTHNEDSCPKVIAAGNQLYRWFSGIGSARC